MYLVINQSLYVTQVHKFPFHLLPLLLQPGIFSPGEYPMRPPFPLGLEGTDARRPKGKKIPIK